MKSGSNGSAWPWARGFYAIIDPAACGGRDPLWVAERTLIGGCAALQLRDKQRSPEQLEPLARALRALCRDANVPFVVNDYAELARRVSADGVHLGQADLPLPLARELVGKAIAIGRSTHSEAQARAAAECGADMIGFGPVFATTSKLDPDPVVGIEGLTRVRRAVALPVVAIGGIGPANVASVAATGVEMAAAISAVCTAVDPASVASCLHAAFRSGEPARRRGKRL